MPTHHKAEEYLDAYIEAAGIGEDKKGSLFHTLDHRRQLTDRRLHRRGAFAMIKRRVRQAGLADTIGCHYFRATGIATS